MIKSVKLKPMPFWVAFLFFGIPILVFYFKKLYVLPLMMQNGIPGMESYMISTIFLTLVPFFLIALLAYRLEQKEFSWQGLKKRFRLNKMDKKTWLWFLGGIVVLLLLSAIVKTMMEWIGSATGLFVYHSSPAEVGHRALMWNEWWLLLIYPVFFFFNIFGEEFLWRGYILPRQELTHKKWAWVVNGALLTMVHVPLGLAVVSMLPLMFITPYLTQKTKNTWVAICIHGFISLFGFSISAFGV